MEDEDKAAVAAPPVLELEPRMEQGSNAAASSSRTTAGRWNDDNIAADKDDEERREMEIDDGTACRECGRECDSQ